MNELVRDRRRFTATATLVYSLYFVAFLALLGWAPDAMGKEVAGLTLALWGGLSVCALTVVFAASANFPPLLLALTWRRFNTAGALAGIAFGAIASVVMIVLSPPVWPGPDSQGSPSAEPVS